MVVDANIVIFTNVLLNFMPKPLPTVTGFYSFKIKTQDNIKYFNRVGNNALPYRFYTLLEQ